MIDPAIAAKARRSVERDGELEAVLAKAMPVAHANWGDHSDNHRPPSLLCPDAFLSPLEIDAVVTRALAEDLGRAGDVTSIATIPEDTPARAIVVARAGRRDRRPAAGRRDVSKARARDRDRGQCAVTARASQPRPR